MSLSYEFDHKLALLAPVLDEHSEWFSYVMRRLIYPDIDIAHPSPVTEATFRQWIGLAAEKGGFDPVQLQNLTETFADLQELANKLTAAPQKPDVAIFDQFLDRYDDFVMQIRRLEYDAVLEDSGLDAATGLRSRKAMEKDLERELERRARLGKPFCLVLARIDELGRVQAAVDGPLFNGVAHEIAALILLCIRSFDDAYRLSDGEFVMALKHSDTAGGAAAINRLRRLLEDNPVHFSEGGATLSITMSYCTAEPIPGDSVETLIQNMRADLAKYNQGGDTAVEYLEQSPLQRFILENESGK